MKDYLYIFVHIPKTGGTSIRKHIRKNIAEDERLFLSFPELRFEPYTLSYKKLSVKVEEKIKSLSEKQKKNIKIIFGEEVPYGVHKYFKRKARYFTVVRDPNKRTLSLYNFYRTRYEKDHKKGVYRSHYPYQLLINGKVPEFFDWVKEKYGVKRNSTETMVQLLQTLGFLDSSNVDSNTIKKSLDKFYFIGTTGQSFDDFSYIYGLLGFNKYFLRQNISKKYITYTKSKTGKILRKKNNLDYELFTEAKSKNNNFKEKNKEYYDIVSRVQKKRKLLTYFTQILFDPIKTIIFIFRKLKRKLNID